MEGSAFVLAGSKGFVTCSESTFSFSSAMDRIRLFFVAIVLDQRLCTEYKPNQASLEGIFDAFVYCRYFRITLYVRV